MVDGALTLSEHLCKNRLSLVLPESASFDALTGIRLGTEDMDKSQRLDQICVGANTLSTIRCVRKPIPDYTDQTGLVFWAFAERCQHLGNVGIARVEDTKPVVVAARLGSPTQHVVVKAGDDLSIGGVCAIKEPVRNFVFEA